MTCVCARSTRVSSITGRITRPQMQRLQHCGGEGEWKRNGEEEKERERGKGTEKEIEREFGEIEIDTAQITNPRRRDKFLVRNSLNKIEIIRVALKFFVAWGRLADNYVPYLHISRDRRRYRYFSGFNTRRAGRSASEFISADNKERTSLSRSRERAR